MARCANRGGQTIDMSDWRLKPIRRDDSWQVEDPERNWRIPDPPRQARLDVAWGAKEHSRDDAGDNEQDA